MFDQLPCQEARNLKLILLEQWFQERYNLYRIKHRHKNSYHMDHII